MPLPLASRNAKAATNRNSESVAAPPTDIARSNSGARAVSRQVRRRIDQLARLRGYDDDAHLILAALVGSILLARAVDDPDLSDGIL